MTDTKVRPAPKENGPTPIAHRNTGASNASINSFLVQFKKDFLAMSITSSKLAQTILDYGENQQKILERLDAIEKKLDELREPKRMQSDSGLSFINVNNSLSNASSPRKGTPDGYATSATESASIVSLPPPEKSSEPELPTIMPPGLHNSIVQEYFQPNVVAEEVVVEEVIAEVTVEETNVSEEVTSGAVTTADQKADPPANSHADPPANSHASPKQLISERLLPEENVPMVEEKRTVDLEIENMVSDITDAADENLTEVVKPKPVRRSKTVATVSAATVATVATAEPKKKRVGRKPKPNA